MPPSFAFFVLGSLSAALAVTTAGCGPKECAFRSTINEPENLSMRKSLLRKGMGDFCDQVRKRNTPLRLSADSPIIGRFYPTQCSVPEGDDLQLSFSGFGYAYTNVTQKMTFTMSASALYRYDFLISEGDRCDIYAYFRPSRIDASNFQVHRIEGTLASTFNGMTSMGDNFGRQLVGQKLQDGFTVIHSADTGNDEFSLGILPVGRKPFHPYQVQDDGRITYENERVEVHQNQRDFVGPISVEDEGRALFISAKVDGAQAIDVLVLRKAEADASLGYYYEYPQVGPLAGAPIAGDVLQAGTELRRTIPVTPGMYYVVFDNSASAGQVSPPANVLDDRAAVVNYLVQIGDAS